MIGCPSTENELDAWSPRPWNSPLESAATPGEERVTSELTEEEELSSGSFSIMFRSRSVCREESFSTRSPPVTVTVVEAPPTCRLMTGVTGTDERTETSVVKALKPGAFATRWYGFSGRLLNW